MRGELSHGLPELTTSGNRIVRADTAQPILLRGVNRSGLEYSEPGDAGFLAAAGITNEEVREIVEAWGANIIRLPFNQDWALHGRRSKSGEDYLTGIDQVISWAAALGAYTILDLQWLDADTVYGHVKDQNGMAQDNHVAPTPNADTIELWRTLAGRYKDEPAVAFDLFNEPHDRLSDDSLPIHLLDEQDDVVESDVASVSPDDWSRWAARLVQEIRAIRPSGIILVAGVDWAFDLRNVTVSGPGVVYSAHIYPDRKQSDWWKAIGRCDEIPTFIGEWGGGDKDLGFGSMLAAVMNGKQLSWTAWSWVDDPKLVQPPGPPDYRPTAFGQLVRNELGSGA